MNPEHVRSVQFIDTFYPVIDGVVQTVNAYANLMNQSAYSCVAAPISQKPFDDSTLPYDVLRCGAFKNPYWEYVIPYPVDLELERRVRIKYPDILHAHSPFMMGDTAIRLARSMHIPVVATFHSKYKDDTLRLVKNQMAAELVAKHVAQFFQKVDSAWACSEGTGETLREYGYKGDIFVINNGTDFKMPSNIDDLARKAAEEYKIPSGKHVLLFCGHLIWQKNIKLVLDTFRSLCDDGDDYRLVIVGNGYAEKDIHQYAESLHFAEGQVSFLGRITDRDMLAGVMRCGDLFFFPSIYDNAPLVVREAAAMGRPALLVAGSNAAETVVHNVSGFTAQDSVESMKSEIERIFAEEGLLERVGSKAQETIPVPWKEIIPHVQHKYAEVIERYQAGKG